MTPNPIFSNMDYYKNKTFQKLMREITKLAEKYDGQYDDPTVRQMFENMSFDFLHASRFWLREFSDATWWREDLK